MFWSFVVIKFLVQSFIYRIILTKSQTMKICIAGFALTQPLGAPLVELAVNAL